MTFVHWTECYSENPESLLEKMSVFLSWKLQKKRWWEGTARNIFQDENVLRQTDKLCCQESGRKIRFSEEKEKVLIKYDCGNEFQYVHHDIPVSASSLSSSFLFLFIYFCIYSSLLGVTNLSTRAANVFYFMNKVMLMLSTK